MMEKMWKRCRNNGTKKSRAEQKRRHVGGKGRISW
jgi:hypothetical protein